MVLLTATPQIINLLSSLPPSALSILTSTCPPTTTTTATSTTEPASPSSSSSSSITSAEDAPMNHPSNLPLPTSPTNPISHKTLIALSRLRLQDATLTTTIPPLNALLRGMRPYIAPPPPKPEPSAEYVALMTRLREEQETREYRAMVAQSKRGLNFSSRGDNEDRADGGEDEDNISPSLVFNILLSVVMCAVAVFQVTKWWSSDAVRVLLSLAAALVVGVAEVGVYSIYLWKVKTAKRKERGKRERKVLIGEYLPPPEDNGAEGEREKINPASVKMVGDSQEIWGRGVNGGMRRRVRDKWERDQSEKETE